MNKMFHRPGVWVVAAAVLALGGCDSVKDVRSEPAAELPTDRVVLKGVIQGLGGGRGITLNYSEDAATARSFVGADPAFPTAEPETVPFTFGSIPVGTAFNVVVSGQPFGKTCTPVSGNTGTIALGQETSVVIDCTPSIARHDLTVTIPPTPAVFSGLQDARVRLYTGEWMQEQAVTSGQTSVTFEDALFSAAGQPSALAYTVSASFVDPEGNVSRCRVTNPSGSNPTANVSNVIIGASASTTQLACQFTISGTVAYSTPPGGTAESGAIPGGLLLEVRDVQANVKASYEVGAYGAFTIGGTVNPTLFSSNINSVYDIVVARQPAGRTCVVGDGGAASLYRTGTNNPVDITATAAAGAAANTRAWGSRLNVFCRARPAAGRELTGTYRLTSSSWTPAPTTAVPNPAAVTVTYNNYDWTTQNLGSSNMMTFFDDGTFLYGTHAYGSGNLPEPGVTAAGYSVQVEHGFYDYDPAGTLRFTLITDTNPTAVYPATFGPVGNVFVTSSRTYTPGLSAAPGAIVNGTPTAGAGIGIWTAAMTNVQKTTVVFTQSAVPQTLSRITGTFGTSPRLDWELTEPQSVTGEMTGTWITRDHRRFWVWDHLNYYGTQVAVLGGAPSMNDACFTIDDVHAPFGIYTRRGTSTRCFPFNRPSRTADAGYTIGFAEAADFHLTNTTVSTNAFVGVAGLNTAAGANVTGSRLVPQFTGILPGFVGRIPGGNSAADGRSPSPIMFKIAPAASFASSVASTTFDEIGQPASLYFDDLDEVGPFTDWCTTEILGIRATLHGNPINYPVYLCRTRVP